MPRFTLESKSEKSAKPPPLGENVSLPELNRSVCDDLLTLGGCAGRGGAGRGGGCLLFFGGSAGLGLVGRAGGAPSLVGACKTAKGSQPNGSLSACATISVKMIRNGSELRNQSVPPLLNLHFCVNHRMHRRDRTLAPNPE